MYKIKYIRGGKTRTSPKTFRTKAKAKSAIKEVRNMQKKFKLGYSPYKRMRIIKK